MYWMGLSGQLADGREDFAAHLGVSSVNHHHALLADLNRDIAASARDQVDVPLHLSTSTSPPGFGPAL